MAITFAGRTGRGSSYAMLALHTAFVRRLHRVLFGPRREQRMDRPAIHDLPKREVVRQLTAMGLTVEPAGTSERFDFLVDGRIRIALRVAFPSSSRRRVKLARRSYSYVYRAWNFNFHHRGVIAERYTDFFVCVALGTGKPLSLEEAFVLPWDSLTGKTFYLPESRRAYRGKFKVFRGAWNRIGALAAGMEDDAA